VPAAATGLPLQPMATATLFDLFLAGSLALILRRASAAPAAPAAPATRTAPPAPDAAVTAQPAGWRFLAALTLAALVVSGLTTPALAATDAGTHAVPHGSHGLPSAPTPESPAGHHH